MTLLLRPVATRYEFMDPDGMTGNPRDHVYDSHTITVEWRGGGNWCVSLGHGWSLLRVWSIVENDWVWEPTPSERDDKFLAATRFPLDVAMGIGARAVRDMTNAQGMVEL